MDNTVATIVILLFLIAIIAVLLLIIFQNQQMSLSHPIQNFSDDFEYVIYRANLSAREIFAKLEKHDPDEVFMDYEYDPAAQLIRLKWFRFGSETTYQVKIFEHPEERILMLQYVEGMRACPPLDMSGLENMEDLNLFWKCIAEAEPIPLYRNKMYYDPMRNWPF